MGTKIKILMVDDELQFQETTTKILKRRGFEVILASSGEEAIAKLEEAPDVMILDLKMPGMDGHETLKQVKKRIPDLPVIMLTGYGTLPSAKETLEKGAFDYLTKPCDIDILSARITDAYRQKKEAGPPEEKRVMGVMIPLKEYTILKKEQRVRDAIKELRDSFTSKISTSRLMETGHRSILVMDAEEKKVEGILAIKDLLKGMMTLYLTESKPFVTDEIEYSHLFWRGMFTRSINQIANKQIKDMMSPPPPVIDGKSNLMEAAYIMVNNNVRRLVVVLENRVIGVIREQDLFFEMEKTLKE